MQRHLAHSIFLATCIFADSKSSLSALDFPRGLETSATSVCAVSRIESTDLRARARKSKASAGRLRMGSKHLSFLRISSSSRRVKFLSGYSWVEKSTRFPDSSISSQCRSGCALYFSGLVSLELRVTIRESKTDGGEDAFTPEVSSLWSHS